MDWSSLFNAPIFGKVGQAMPEAYGANAPIMDPLANAVISAGRTAMIPGQAYNSPTPVTTQQMVQPAADLAGLVTLGAGAMPAEANALRMGIKAYHGSPHDFDAFSLDKIGTGEGAQAYGHGLYFAENEGVARGYRDALGTQAGGKFEYQGPEYTKFQLKDMASAETDPDKKESLEWLAHMTGEGKPGQYTFKQAAEALGPQAQESLFGPSVVKHPGRMYEVQINADPEHFLDWDKPLSEQPKGFSAFKNVWENRGEPTIDFSKMSPDEALNILERHNGPELAAEELRDAGIPGIKYLDQGSRAAGDGSRNYVVFDDKLIDILRKYGIVGGAGLGLSNPIFARQGNT